MTIDCAVRGVKEFLNCSAYANVRPSEVYAGVAEGKKIRRTAKSQDFMYDTEPEAEIRRLCASFAKVASELARNVKVPVNRKIREMKDQPLYSASSASLITSSSSAKTACLTASD
jgi:hypothetical protein